MPVSKAQIKATNKYNTNAYDRLNIMIPKGKRDVVKAFADEHGESINGLINNLLRREIGLTVEQWETRASKTATPE